MLILREGSSRKPQACVAIIQPTRHPPWKCGQIIYSLLFQCDSQESHLSDSKLLALTFAFPLILKRADLYNQQNILEMMMCDFRAQAIKDIRASTLLSLELLAWEKPGAMFQGHSHSSREKPPAKRLMPPGDSQQGTE